MRSAAESRTSATLLGRVRENPADSAAWGEFVERYSRKIYGWCRRWKLQPADAEDVTQEVLTCLAVRMRTFTYDPSRSFRGWLKTLAYRAWQDFVAARRRSVAGSGDSQVQDMLDFVEAREDLVRRLNEAFDLDLLDEAMTRVSLRVKRETWEAFRLLAVDGRSGAEVASLLGMTVAAVFMAKSRVQAMLRAELTRLEAPECSGREESQR